VLAAVALASRESSEGRWSCRRKCLRSDGWCVCNLTQHGETHQVIQKKKTEMSGPGIAYERAYASTLSNQVLNGRLALFGGRMGATPAGTGDAKAHRAMQILWRAREDTSLAVATRAKRWADKSVGFRDVLIPCESMLPLGGPFSQRVVGKQHANAC
jgi:hypothetical protein